MSQQEMENGEICVICKKQLNEDYGRPIACENCGGDAVLCEITEAQDKRERAIDKAMYDAEESPTCEMPEVDKMLRGISELRTANPTDAHLAQDLAENQRELAGGENVD